VRRLSTKWRQNYILNRVGMSDDEKELSLVYWRGVFVPVVVSVLVLTSISIMVTMNVTQPHELVKKATFGGFSPKAFRSIR
jgi:hypothetical protein